MCEENTPTPLAFSCKNEVHFGKGITDCEQLTKDLVSLRETGGVGIAPKVALYQAYGDIDNERRFNELFSDAKSLGFECTMSGLDIVFTPT